MTAKEFEKQYGFGCSNRKSLWIGEFCFFYVFGLSFKWYRKNDA